MLIRDAQVAGQRRDVAVRAGTITAIAARLDAQPGEEVIAARGGALLPGLHDHHLHLDATAAAMASVACGPPQVASRDVLAVVLRASPGNGWLRGVGYHDSIGRIDRAWLDAHAPDRPIRIQHRGGRMWVLNSRAMALVGIAAPGDGRLVDGDALLGDRIGRTPPDLAPVQRALAAHGVTGVTDATPRNGPSDLMRYARALLPQQLLVMGRRTLDGLAGVGPVKLHYHDHDLPALAVLADEVAGAHAAGRAIAAHCVTLAELMLVLAAVDAAGAHPGDRIEHAGVAPPHVVDWVARLGCTIVTQPHFISERGDAYRREVAPADLPWLYRLRSWRAAGVPLAAGSDAPFGGLNPWAAMAAAVSRPADLGGDEAIDPDDALALFLAPLTDPGGAPRRVAVGAAADLCLLDTSWAQARRMLATVRPVLTIAGGEVVFRR